MCTAIAKKGKDLVYGYNLDVDPAVWNFGLYRTESCFSVRITVGKTKYLTHGVNKEGQFGNLPYMNGEAAAVPKGMKKERIDLMTDRYIRGKYTFEDVENILRTKAIVNVPGTSMHSLLGNREGELVIVEPGYGIRKADGDYAVLTNFPVLAKLEDYSNPFYGKERFDRACEVLQNSGDGFSVMDALHLLNEVKQEGQWGTRISFAYSRNENAVYYFLDGDASGIRVHRFV